jgi:hypothetical protein
MSKKPSPKRGFAKNRSDLSVFQSIRATLDGDPIFCQRSRTGVCNDPEWEREKLTLHFSAPAADFYIGHYRGSGAQFF